MELVQETCATFMQVLVKHVQNRAANTSTKKLDLYKKNPGQFFYRL